MVSSFAIQYCVDVIEANSIAFMASYFSRHVYVYGGVLFQRIGRRYQVSNGARRAYFGVRIESYQAANISARDSQLPNFRWLVFLCRLFEWITVCDFRAVIVAGGSVFAVSSALMFRGACLSIGDYSGNVTGVRFSVGSIIRSSPAKAREEYGANAQDERVRTNRVSHVEVKSGDVLSMDVCMLIIPVEV